jgi:hypothetical protein
MALDRGAHELLQAESQLLNNIILYLKQTMSKHFPFEFSAISDDAAVVLSRKIHDSFMLLGKCAEVRIKTVTTRSFCKVGCYLLVHQSRVSVFFS